MVDVPAKRGRGRPRKPFAMARVSVYLSPRVYDECCRIARRADQPLAVVLRHIITKHVRTVKDEP